MVAPADVHDAVAAKDVLLRLRLLHPELTIVWADSAYADTLVGWAKSFLGLTVNLSGRRHVHPTSQGKGFGPCPSIQTYSVTADPRPSNRAR